MTSAQLVDDGLFDTGFERSDTNRGAGKIGKLDRRAPGCLVVA